MGVDTAVELAERPEDLQEEARQAIWAAFVRAARAREADACYTIAQLHEACLILMRDLP